MKIIDQEIKNEAKYQKREDQRIYQNRINEANKLKRKEKRSEQQMKFEIEEEKEKDKKLIQEKNRGQKQQLEKVQKQEQTQEQTQEQLEQQQRLEQKRLASNFSNTVTPKQKNVEKPNDELGLNIYKVVKNPDKSKLVKGQFSVSGGRKTKNKRNRFKKTKRFKKHEEKKIN